jgi:hypothetical protein
MKGPISFRGVINRHEPMSVFESGGNYEQVWIYGTVNPSASGAVVSFEVQGDKFTPTVVMVSAIFLLGLGTLVGWLQMQEGRFPGFPIVIWPIGLLYYTFSMFTFRRHANQVKSFFTKLLDGKEFDQR